MKGDCLMDTVTMTVKKDNLHKYIDEMDDYQLELVYSFIKTLFNLDD